MDTQWVPQGVLPLAIEQQEMTWWESEASGQGRLMWGVMMSMSPTVIHAGMVVVTHLWPLLFIAIGRLVWSQPDDIIVTRRVGHPQATM